MPGRIFKTIDIRDIIGQLSLTDFEHMFRVGKLAELISSELSISTENVPLSNETKQVFGKAAFYHDIGKTYISSELLFKPGRFTPEETETMKKHTLCAEVVFRDALTGLITGVPEEVIMPSLEAAAFHHEWWNGNGYPYGKKGDDIPLVARITSVCDAYDAMTSDRPYSQAKKHSEACLELLAFSGTQFDPAVVCDFLSCQKDICEFSLNREALNHAAADLYRTYIYDL